MLATYATYATTRAPPQAEEEELDSSVVNLAGANASVVCLGHPTASPSTASPGLPEAGEDGGRAQQQEGEGTASGKRGSGAGGGGVAEPAAGAGAVDQAEHRPLSATVAGASGEGAAMAGPPACACGAEAGVDEPGGASAAAQGWPPSCELRHGARMARERERVSLTVRRVPRVLPALLGGFR